MSTDLRTALRDAVADPPEAGADLGMVLDLGSRRVRRRRRVLTAATGAVAAAAVVVGLLVLPAPGRDESTPLPADVVHLDPDDAEALDLDVLASARTVTDPEEDLSHDRFEGLTPDGLVLRGRYRDDDNTYEYGLVDPATGRTDWLPRPPGRLAAPLVVALTTERVVLFERGHAVVLVLDRATRTWTRAFVRVPPGIEVHAPPQLRLGPDGRLYLGANLEGSAPMHWWSYPLAEGGDPRPEPDLERANVAWEQDVRVTADARGRVVRTVAGARWTFSRARPASCPMPEQPFRPETALAGDRPVVSYWCGNEHDPVNVTVVEAQDGRPAVEVPGIVLAADRDHVLLSGGGKYPLHVLDLDRLTLSGISDPRPAGYEEGMLQVDLAGGLVLWNTPGPTDDRNTYDMIWKVARLP